MEIPVTYSAVPAEEPRDPVYKPKPKNPHLESKEWKFITWLAPINGIKLKEPNMSCKHCYGKGYTGYVAGGEIDFEGEKIKVPISCNCIVWDIAEMLPNPMAKWNLDKQQFFKKAKV